MTGGSCTNSDGSSGLFVQLPDGTCLPVIPTGNPSTPLAFGRPIATGTGVTRMFLTAGPPPTDTINQGKTFDAVQYVDPVDGKVKARTKNGAIVSMQ